MTEWSVYDRARRRQAKNEEVEIAMKPGALLVPAVLCLCSAVVCAQTKWDMPTPYSDGEFHTRTVKAFAEDVKKNSGGQLDITVHSNQ